MVATTGFGDQFIALDRTFHELEFKSGESDSADLARTFRRGASLLWSDLLKDYRVVLLSEAGSGKTAEIRHVAQKLRQEGKRAFFVRIEHVAQNFEDAFEEGTFDEFRAWASTGEEGWLRLDSVDEARLRDPKDFERAIRKLGGLLKAVLQHTHIVVTGRTTAWRPQTDLVAESTRLDYVTRRRRRATLFSRSFEKQRERKRFWRSWISHAPIPSSHRVHGWQSMPTPRRRLTLTRLRDRQDRFGIFTTSLNAHPLIIATSGTSRLTGSWTLRMTSKRPTPALRRSCRDIRPAGERTPGTLDEPRASVPWYRGCQGDWNRSLNAWYRCKNRVGEAEGKAKGSR